MADEELRAAAERLDRLHRSEGTQKALDRYCDNQAAVDERLLVKHYLARPPLTRERIAAVVAELFHAQAQFVVRGGGMVHLDGLTEHLCRLLGVDS